MFTSSQIMPILLAHYFMSVDRLFQQSNKMNDEAIVVNVLLIFLSTNENTPKLA